MIPYLATGGAFLLGGAIGFLILFSLMLSKTGSLAGLIG